MKCERCHSPAPARDPHGNCAVCLLEGALGGEDFGADAPPVPDRIGEYTLLEEIGRGGAGVVYRARHERLGRVVALKMLHGAGRHAPDAFERFRIEASAVARLEHPQIAPLYETGADEGRFFLALRFFEHGTLASALKSRRFSQEQSAGLIATAARAIHYAHQRGVLHRDLKPSNILLDENGKPHIADFGLAKLADEETNLTLSSSILGSPNYMAPEQAKGQSKDVSVAADVYSLGAILFELMAGRPPFVGETPLAVLMQAAEQDPPSPRSLNPEADRDLEAICLHCLEKEPRRRYASAAHLAEDLERWLRREPIAIRPPGPIERGIKWVRRRPLVSALTGLVAVAVAAGMAGTLWQWRVARRTAEAARLDAYLTGMDLVQRQFQSQPGRAREVLDRYRPKAGEKDLRNWEWRYFWDQTRPPRPVKQWAGEKEVFSTELSPDGKWLAIGEMGGGARLLDAGTLKLIFSSAAGANENPAPFVPSGNRVGARLAFIPGTNLLAWCETRGASNCTIEFLNLDSKRIVRSWPQPYIVRNMVPTPDGRRLIVSYQPLDGRTIVWDLDSERKITEAPITAAVSNFSPGQVLAVSPDGRWMTVDEFPGFIRVMEVETGAVVWRLPLRNQYSLACAFSPEGRTLAVAAGFGAGSVPELWDLERGESLGKFESESALITRLRFSPDGKRLYGSGSGRTIRIWEVAGRSLAKQVQTGNGNSFDISIAADGRIFAAGHGVGLWDPERSRERRPVHYAPLARFWTFLPDSKHILGVTTNGTVALAGGKDWDELEEFKSGSTNANAVAVLPDNEGYLVGGIDGSLVARRWGDHAAIKTYEPMGSRIFHLRVEPKRRTAIALDMENVRAWRLDSGATIANAAEPLQGDNTPNVQFAKGRWSSLRYRGEIMHIDLADGRVSHERLPHGDSEAFDYSPSGKWAVTSGATAPIRLYHGDWRFARVLNAQATGGFYATFAPDERRVVTAKSGENAVELWEIETGTRICGLGSSLDLARETRFSPDGNVIAQSGSAIPAIAIWQAPSWEEIAQAEAGTDE